MSAGQPAPVTGADGRIALVLGLAAKRSMDEGRPVEPSTAPRWVAGSAATGGEGDDAARQPDQ